MKLLLLLIAIISLSSSLPPPMSAPNLTIAYRATGLPQHVANVWVRHGRGGLWPSPVAGKRPVIIGPLNGGGFAAGTGTPIGAPTTTGTDILSLLFQEGCVIVTMGYTVDTPSLPGNGRYGTEYQAEDDIELVIDALKLHLDRIPDMDLRRPGLLGRSAGSSVVLNYARHHDCSFVVTWQTVSTFAAYKDNVGVKHFLTTTGLPAANIGASDFYDMQEQATLPHATELKCPVFLMGEDPQTYFGSLEVRDFVEIFPPSNVHPVEHVMALKHALQGWQHYGESIFYLGAPDPRLNDVIHKWCLDRLGIRK